jgi:hypothetical protein
MAPQGRRRPRHHIPSWQVTVVGEEDFVPFDRAREALRVRTRFPLNVLLATGGLRYAATGPKPWYEGDVGVTASSLAPEAEWWSSATARERRRRFLRLSLRMLVRSI